MKCHVIEMISKECEIYMQIRLKNMNKYFSKYISI